MGGVGHATHELPAGYVNMVKMLFLNGWLYYAFFATCECFSAMAVEMALRMRLPPPAGKRDRRGLKELLQEAVESGLLRDSGFPSLENRAEEESGMASLESSVGKIPQYNVSYVSRLTEYLPKIRNSFAHPQNHSIITPGMAIDGICVATEVINQLWPETAPEPSS